MSDRFLEYHESIGAWFYIGPFVQGIDLASREEPNIQVAQTEAGLLVRSEMGFGLAHIHEIAWRYYLGSHFGPIDDGYDADDLERALNAGSLGTRQ